MKNNRYTIVLTISLIRLLIVSVLNMLVVNLMLCMIKIKHFQIVTFGSQVNVIPICTNKQHDITYRLSPSSDLSDYPTPLHF